MRAPRRNWRILRSLPRSAGNKGRQASLAFPALILLSWSGQGRGPSRPQRSSSSTWTNTSDAAFSRKSEMPFSRSTLGSCAAPKVDKYIVDFLGKRMPKEHDSKLSRIQGSVLASARPLVSAWQSLLEEGIEKDPVMMVPATEVLAMIQRTLCLMGNASEKLSQVRRAKILEAIDPSWKKFSEDGFPSAKDTLFGADFQSSLTSRVEKDTALSKAVAISKRSRRDPDPSSRKDRPKSSRFFRGGPPRRYGTRQGKSFFPYSASVPRNQRDGKHLPSSRFGKKPLFHEPKLPQDHNNPPQTQLRRP